MFSSSVSPLTISISYGWPEESQCEAGVLGDNCKAEGIPNWMVYLTRAEAEWAKLAAKGHTIIASSGDTGAPGDNNDCSLTQKFPFHPGYPATGAWLTSLGATFVTASSDAPELDLGAAPPVCSISQCTCSTSTKEAPAMYKNSQFTGGGGYSLHIPQPSWQVAAVKAYENSNANKPDAKYYNASNRAFPDISAVGHNVLVNTSPGWELVGGTSCSCPIFAGMVSQINSWRLSNNLPSMGHIAPLIYKMLADSPDVFNTVAAGENQCTESGCCKGLGWSSGPVGPGKWNPVTGVGSPNFGKILDYIQKMDYTQYNFWKKTHSQ
jgi:subtilase family serine protease